jgi:hypothetical protein
MMYENEFDMQFLIKKFMTAKLLIDNDDYQHHDDAHDGK